MSSNPELEEDFKNRPASYKDMNRMIQEIIGRIDNLEKTLLTEIYKEADVINKNVRLK